LFEIYILPFTALDACANLCRRSPQLSLLIGINRLLHAGRTGRSVRPLKAAMQAVVPHHPVAMAIAGLLMQDSRDCLRHLVRGDLVGVSKDDSGQLISAKHRWTGLYR